MKIRLLYIILLCIGSMNAYAWDWWPLPMMEPDTCRDTLLYAGGVQVVSSSGTVAPFWLHANRHGEVATLPHSGSIHAGIIKPATRPNRWYDYDGAVVLNGRIAGTSVTAQPHRIDGTGFFSALYAHARLYIVDITVGIKPLEQTIGDAELSSGSLLISPNAHPIPRISIGIDRWTAIPGLFGYAELKGGLTQGWMGDNNPYVRHTLLHHAYIGGRVGGKLPVHISYEFHHAAQWGGYNDKYGDLGNNFSAFLHALTARGGGKSTNEQLNAQGNHLLSQFLTLSAGFDKWQVELYWQDIQEDGRPRWIGKGQNSKDGLWGISVQQTYWPYISGLTFEVIQTTDQSGPWHDKDAIVIGGKDNYYWNIIYQQGWTYFGRTIGSPLLTPQDNRVWAYHAGIKGDIYGFRYRALCTYADHYGTYDVPMNAHNTSILVEVTKQVQKAWGLEFGLSFAGDIGNLYGNTFGGMVTVRKQGIIKHW